MIKNYIDQSTKKVHHTIEIAVGELAALKQNLLTPDFILLALLFQPDSEAFKILESLTAQTVDAVTQIKGKIYQHYQQATPVQLTQIMASQELDDTFRIALEEAKKLGE